MCFQLGIDKVLAEIHDPGDQDPMAVVNELYIELNQRRSLKDRDQVMVGLRGGPIFGRNAKSTVDLIHALYPRGVPKTVEAAAGTTVLGVAKRVVKYVWPSLKDRNNLGPYNSKIRITLEWLVRNKQQQHATVYMRHGYSAGSLGRAVAANNLVPLMNVKGKTA